MDTQEKDARKIVIRPWDEDIKRIIEGLKSTIVEEHTPLVFGFEHAINA